MRALGAHRRPQGDEGFTLIEMAVAALVFTILIALLIPTFVALTNGSSTIRSTTQVNSGLQPALLALERQVESATVLWNPTSSSSNKNTGVSAGWAVLMYTQWQTQARCVQWRATITGLGERSWSPSSPPSALTFAVQSVGVGIVNASTKKPFQLAGTSSPSDLQLDMDLFATGGSQGPTVEFKTAMLALGIAGTATKCSTPPAL
jgi:prepilin-type N-terminal cleavage/methylation domain-containing protein